MTTVETDINFDVSIDQMTKLLWVLKDGPATRDAASMYEKVLRDEWETVRRLAANTASSGHDDIPELPDGALMELIHTMDEIKEFIAKSVAAL